MAELVHKCIDNAFTKLLEGDLYDAAQYFECAEKENPDNIHILPELSNVYYILGEMSKCIAYYRKVLIVKPDSPYVMYRLGVALYRSTKFTEAVKVFNDIINSGKHLPMTYLWLGLAYYHLGKEDKSIASYRKLLEYCPET